MKYTQRRAMSPLIGVMLAIGMTVAVGGIVGISMMNQTDTLTQSDAVIPSNVSITKVGATSYISANIKNIGSSDVSLMSIEVQVDADTTTNGVQPFTAPFEPSTITPGQTTTVKTAILDSSSSNISMSQGSKYLVTIAGTTADSGAISYPISIRVK